jgi:hypothetical protein
MAANSGDDRKEKRKVGEIPDTPRARQVKVIPLALALDSKQRNNPIELQTDRSAF